MANKSIKVDGKSIDYEVTSLVKFADGIQYETAGSVAAASVLKQYKAEKASQVPPVVETPAPAPAPVPESPAVIIKPSPGEPKMISLSDYGNLKDVDGEYLKVKDAVAHDQYWLRSVHNTRIDLSGVQFTTKNMPAMELKGDCSGLILDGANFKDANIGVSYRGDDVPFGTIVKGLQLLNFKAVNSGALLTAGGSLTNKGFSFVLQDLVVKGFSFLDSAKAGNVVWAQALDGFDISDGIIDNINTEVNNHNGILMLAGNGRLSNVRCTNHQGDLMRIVPMQVVGTGKKVIAESNFIRGSRKYGAFEVQVYQDNINTGKFLPADVLIQNNAAGKLNSMKNWAGKLIDLYDTYGNIEILNNVGWEMYHDGKPMTSIVNYESVSSATTVIEKGNIYFATEQDAVANAPALKSLLTGVGAQ
jgi:hypothetical protein